MKTKYRSCLTYMLTGVAVFFVLLARQRGDLWHPPLLWEDGTLFLSDALNGSFLTNLFTPFQGYLHVAPRMVAETASVEYLSYAALIYHWLAVLISACVLSFPVLYVFERLGPLALRLCLVFLSALMPWQTEVLGNIACLQWYLFYYLALLSLADVDRAHVAELAVFLLLVVMAVFSSPLSILCVPIFMWRCFHAPSRRSRMVYGSAFVLILSIIGMIHVLVVTPDIPVSFAVLPNYLLFVIKALGYKVLCMTLFGEAWSVAYGRQWTICYAACLTFLIFLSGVRMISHSYPRPENDQEAFPSFVHGAAWYYLLVPLLFAGAMRPFYVEHFVMKDQYFGATRYFTVSSWFLILIVLLNLRHIAKRFRGWRGILALALPLCIYAVVLQRNFTYPQEGDYGWSAAVDRYYEALSVGDPACPLFYNVTLPHDPPWKIKLPFMGVPEETRHALQQKRSAAHP